jgi:hypothetical protein
VVHDEKEPDERTRKESRAPGGTVVLVRFLGGGEPGVLLVTNGVFWEGAWKMGYEKCTLADTAGHEGGGGIWCCTSTGYCSKGPGGDEMVFEKSGGV